MVDAETRRRRQCEATKRWRMANPEREALSRQKNRERARKRYHADPAAARAARRAWVLAHPRQYLWASARVRAAKAGVKFTIKPEDIAIPRRCPYLGIKLTLLGGQNGASPSLDRIDNRKGYVPGNIEIVSQQANRAKNNLSPAQLKAFAAALMERFGR